MLDKSAASTTIGISMGLETCRILGQVSLNLLYWKKNLQTERCGPGETNEKTADIQARSFMARTLDEIGKENAKLKERQKWSHAKPKLDNARRLRGIYFLDPEDKEFKETIKNSRKKLETPEIRGKTNEIKSKPACILEASEFTRPRMGES